MPDFTKHLDRHLYNAMLLARLANQHPSQNENNQKAQVALKMLMNTSDFALIVHLKSTFQEFYNNCFCNICSACN